MANRAIKFPFFQQSIFGMVSIIFALMTAIAAVVVIDFTPETGQELRGIAGLRSPSGKIP